MNLSPFVHEYSLDVTLYVVGVSLLYFLLRQLIIDVFNVWTSRKIEEAKGSVSEKVYVSKIRFDTEFQIYRKLSSVFYDVLESISFLIPDGLNDARFSDSQQVKAEMQMRYFDAVKAVMNAKRVLGRNMAFIQDDIYKAYRKTLAAGETQLFVFRQKFRQLDGKKEANNYNEWPTFGNEDYRRTLKMSNELEEINANIRNYLSTLDILK